MSQIIENNNNNNNNWEYLPDIPTFTQYFKQNDLIELSKVSKGYRSQLKPQALRKVNIDDRVIKYLKLYTKDNNYQYENAIIYLRSDFGNNCHLVREVVIYRWFSNDLAKDLFTLLPRISNIKIIDCQCYGLKNLISILQDYKYLKHVSITSSFRKFKPLLDSVYYSFFYRLSSIHMVIPQYLAESQLPFDIIDSNYVNLKRLTIVNNRILSKLSNCIPSLLYVEFSHEYQFDSKILKNFITNNPQLRQISICDWNLNENIVNCLLALRNLYKLEILFKGHEIDSSKLDTENYSIKHITYKKHWRYYYSTAVPQILKLCKNLKVCEISDIKCYEHLARDDFPIIDTLLLSELSNCDLSELTLGLTKFNRLKFRGSYKFGEIFDQLPQYPNIEWVPKQEYTKETDEFTLIKKF
ncbi:hypothetical protein CONCODRAFT_12177 [Conidiobolus coronatus NRRL 28638]|uniref:F-box domain-containing protein n=1 Tax=Conidiobolus coronatus (strain ATCC 28846 / CBS 209.66 / NRRL 28638) TaxID=796925 RepID=A0A137NTW8_CONC2|nr:hypothetical protein CONCODRAFT_12177 [Conidiobolus coronatus NRRL 28638]|eukprot:KXN66064.1 hypothetical protein CONCODRAFT_12177 [Conidiobolus coronatus NRRL 28638]